MTRHLDASALPKVPEWGLERSFSHSEVGTQANIPGTVMRSGRSVLAACYLGVPAL
jgi:hypothetical protein